LLFSVLFGYFSVRPVRETIGTILGREATQNLWFFTALFAIVIVPTYGWLVARVRYVGISVMNLLLVSVFWSFMLEILSSEQTKRLFGLIAAGGTAGAFFG